MVRGATKTLVIDLGFLLEGQTPEELPESLIGAFRLHQLDCTSAKHLDTSKELPLLPRPLHAPSSFQQQQQQGYGNSQNPGNPSFRDTLAGRPGYQSRVGPATMQPAPAAAAAGGQAAAGGASGKPRALTGAAGAASGTAGAASHQQQHQQVTATGAAPAPCPKPSAPLPKLPTTGAGVGASQALTGHVSGPSSAHGSSAGAGPAAANSAGASSGFLGGAVSTAGQYLAGVRVPLSSGSSWQKLIGKHRRSR